MSGQNSKNTILGTFVFDEQWSEWLCKTPAGLEYSVIGPDVSEAHIARLETLNRDEPRIRTTLTDFVLKQWEEDNPPHGFTFAGAAVDADGCLDVVYAVENYDYFVLVEINDANEPTGHTIVDKDAD